MKYTTKLWNSLQWVMVRANQIRRLKTITLINSWRLVHYWLLRADRMQPRSEILEQLEVERAQQLQSLTLQEAAKTRHFDKTKGTTALTWFRNRQYKETEHNIRPCEIPAQSNFKPISRRYQAPTCMTLYSCEDSRKRYTVSSLFCHLLIFSCLLKAPWKLSPSDSSQSSS